MPDIYMLSGNHLEKYLLSNMALILLREHVLLDLQKVEVRNAGS